MSPIDHETSLYGSPIGQTAQRPAAAGPQRHTFPTTPLTVASWQAALSPSLKPRKNQGVRRCRCCCIGGGAVAWLPLTPTSACGVSSGRARTPAWHGTHSSSTDAITRLNQDLERQEVRARGAR